MNPATPGIDVRVEDCVTIPMLDHVIADLKAKSDIMGALLMEEGGRVISRAMPTGNVTSGLSKLLPVLMDNSKDIDPLNNIMFPHILAEHNGQRILARSVGEGLFLLVLLHESCYMGPTLLDTENSIIKIREIMNSPCPINYQK